MEVWREVQLLKNSQFSYIWGERDGSRGSPQIFI